MSDGVPAGTRSRRRTALLVAACLLVCVVVLLSGASGRWLWPHLANRFGAIHAFAAGHPAASLLLFIVAVAALTAACVPVGPAAGVLGGALFGSWFGAVTTIAATATGSFGLFLLARNTLGEWFAARRPSLLARIRPRIEREGFLGLMALRVAPITPGWLACVAAGTAGMRVFPFVAATTFGITPAMTVYAHAGAGLSEALLTATMPNLQSLLGSLLVPLLTLSAIVALPIALRAWRSSRAR